jgi:hypothetical protein
LIVEDPMGIFKTPLVEFEEDEIKKIKLESQKTFDSSIEIDTNDEF